MGPTRSTQEFFNRGVWGWFNAQWRKLSMLWGYTDVYHQRVFEENPTPPTVTINLTAVPAGYVRTIRDVAAACDQTNTSHLTFSVVVGGVEYEKRSFVPAIAAFFYGYSPGWVLEAGDYVRVVFYSTAVGDDFTVTVNGYDMAVS